MGGFRAGESRSGLSASGSAEGPVWIANPNQGQIRATPSFSDKTDHTYTSWMSLWLNYCTLRKLKIQVLIISPPTSQAPPFFLSSFPSGFSVVPPFRRKRKPRDDLTFVLS